MRIWFKIYTDTHLMRDITIENDSDDTRTHKIFKALEDACLAFDLGKPIWLDSNVSDFKRHGKTRFTKDNFVEDIDFDFLEMHIIEEMPFGFRCLTKTAFMRRPWRITPCPGVHAGAFLVVKHNSTDSK